MDSPFDQSIADFDEGVDIMSEDNAKNMLKQMFRILLKFQIEQEQQVAIAKRLLGDK